MSEKGTVSKAGVVMRVLQGVLGASVVAFVIMIFLVLIAMLGRLLVTTVMAIVVAF